MKNIEMKVSARKLEPERVINHPRTFITLLPFARLRNSGRPASELIIEEREDRF
jgi:hypothetical protein